MERFILDGAGHGCVEAERGRCAARAGSAVVREAAGNERVHPDTP